MGEAHRFDGLCQVGGGWFDRGVVSYAVDEVAVLFFTTAGRSSCDFRFFPFKDDFTAVYPFHIARDILAMYLVSLQACTRRVVVGQLRDHAILKLDQRRVNIPVARH